MFILGALSGLCAALFQSLGYIFSRLYVKRGGTALHLTVLAQLWIALWSVPLFIFCFTRGFQGDWHWLWALFGSALGTTGGEVMFFLAEKEVEPSRLASLMGLRVVVIAVIFASLGVESYNGLQVAGIVLAALSAGVMNERKGGFAWRGMHYLAFALLFYAVSDCSIKFLIAGIRTESLLHSALLAASLVNLLIGIALAGFFFVFRLRIADFKPAVPYSGVWFAKQLLLYFCYGLIGPVFANVVMASRGIFSIVLTLIFLHRGVEGLETHTSPRMWIRRGIAALMMVGAIMLYTLG